MMDTKYFMDGQKTLNFSSKLPSFDKKNTHSLIIVGLAFLLVGGYGVAQNAQGYDVEIGQNGIKMYSGTLDVQGNDIVSAGTTVFDGAAGNIVTGALPSNIDASTLDGNNLSQVRGGTTATDVGLGNVENTAAVNESGDTMTGDLNMNDNNFLRVERISDDNQVDPANSCGTIIAFCISSDSGKMLFTSSSDVVLASDHDGGSGGEYTCTLKESDGVFECPQGKSWVHQMNTTHEAVYNSQESAKMRAVFEGSVEVDSKKNVSLPNHFSQTVSDTEPMLRAVATPDELATVAVTEKNSEYIIIKSTEAVGVDFRVTGVRDGFEDKQVVREKE